MSYMVAFLPIGIFLGLITGFLGRSKGESFFAWWVFGTLVFPLALIFVLVTKDRRRYCPHCAEVIKPAARVCPHCQRDVAPGQVATT